MVKRVKIRPQLFEMWINDVLNKNRPLNDVLNKNRHQYSNPVSTVPKKDIVILLPYLGLPREATKSLNVWNHGTNSTNRSHYNPELFTEQITGIIMVFTFGKPKRRLHDRETENLKALANHVKATGHIKHQVGSFWYFSEGQNRLPL